MIDQALARWIVRPGPSRDTRIRLVCVPYAGGGSQVFHTWAEGLPDDVDVCSVNLPGRGRRFGEPAYRDLMPLARSLAASLRTSFDKPVALFGHSMGALVSFEVARVLRRDYGVEPVHLIASGAAAPHFPDTHGFHKLPDDALAAKVRDLNGMKVEVFENRELLTLLMPMLRADFTLSETYLYEAGPPLGCPITVLGGSDDPLVPVEKLYPWKIHTTGPCHVQIFPGDHFFLDSSRTEVLHLIGRRLMR